MHSSRSAAVAAVVLLAVVVGSQFLPGDAIVGVPVETSSPAPSATLSPVTGQFTFDADREITVVMDALADGSTWVLRSQETPSPDSPGAP